MPLSNCESRKQEWKIGEGGIAQRTYKVFGTLDIEEAKDEFLAIAPDTWLGMGRDTGNITVKEIGYQAWEGTVPYGKAANNSGGGPPPAVFSFKIGSNKQRITCAPVVNAYPATPGPAAAPDFRDAINADGKGNIEGVDFYAPEFSFEMEQYVPADEMTNSFLGTLISLCCKYNNTTFRGCASGEALYLGCSGAPDVSGKYRLTHSFIASPNITGVAIAGGTITVTKKGWDYLWVHYKSFAEANAHVMKPQAAYVHALTGPGDFSLIGIET